jgi:hypothetical protein
MDPVGDPAGRVTQLRSLANQGPAWFAMPALLSLAEVPAQRRGDHLCGIVAPVCRKTGAPAAPFML